MAGVALTAHGRRSRVPASVGKHRLPQNSALPALRLVGTVPPEVWNRLGTKILPKLRSGSGLKVGVYFSVTVGSDVARSLESDLRQILDDLGLADRVRIDET